MYARKNHILKADITIKTVSILVTVIMLLTTVPMLVGASEPTNTQERVETFYFSFSAPIVVPDGDYVRLEIEGAPSTTTEKGAPELPALSYQVKLPFGATDVSVEWSHSSIQTMTVNGVIAPHPIPLPLFLPDRNYLLVKQMLNFWRQADPLGGIKQWDEDDNLVQTYDENIYGQQLPFGEHFSSNIYVGRDTDMELKTFVFLRVVPFVLTDVFAGEGNYLTEATATIRYQDPQTTHELSQGESVELLILAPRMYIRPLQPLVAHKEAVGISTKLVSLDEIYAEAFFTTHEKYSRDNQEKIKYFIYQTTMNWGVEMVMLVGGWRTFLGFNIPAMTFPIRCSHLWDGGEYQTTDQYYSCFLKYDPVEGFVFDDWDSNGNNRFAEWDSQGYDTWDPVPDVVIGRLACRNTVEVRNVVNKIILYETSYYENEPWFNSMLTVGGDGFAADFDDLAFYWDVSSVPNGEYMIYAQSRVGSLYGPIDKVRVTVDHAADSKLVFREDDHLKLVPLDPEQPEIYPAKPVAEIIIPGIDGCILGKTDVGPYVAAAAYHGSGWAVVRYVDKVLSIRCKSYDPSEKGTKASSTVLEVWVNNSAGQTVFHPAPKNSIMHYEGEVCSDYILKSYVPDVFNGNDFTKIKAWTSNGNFMRMRDILDYLSQGQGFVYFNGHSSCMAWGDHFPGVPGGRVNGMVNGLAAINMKYGYERYAAKEGDPLFPIDQLTNGHKLPILWLSGCHSGQFDTSLISLLSDPENVLFGARYGTWTPEGMAWWMVRVPQGGSIATFGVTGLGYGRIGAGAYAGVTGYIFGQNVKAYFVNGIKTLGVTHLYALNAYLAEFPDLMGDKIDRKTWESYQLLGDPSLRIGGYPPQTGALNDDGENEQGLTICASTQTVTPVITGGDSTPVSALGSPVFKITTNPKDDINPAGLVSTPDGRVLVSYTVEEAQGGKTNPGYSYGGGTWWHHAVFGQPLSSVGQSLFSWWTWNNNEKKMVQNFVGGMYDSGYWPILTIPDIFDPTGWDVDRYWGYMAPTHPGRWGSVVTAYTNPETGATTYGGAWSQTGGVYCWWFGSLTHGGVGPSGVGSDFISFNGDCDQSTAYHYYVFERKSTGTTFVVRAPNAGAFEISNFPGRRPDVAVSGDGWTYVAYQTSGNGDDIEVRRSNNNGATWDIVTVHDSGTNPKLVVQANGQVDCYFIGQDGTIYKAISIDHGATWGAAVQILNEVVDTTQHSPYQVTRECLVFAKSDKNLYITYLVPSRMIGIGDIEVINNGRNIKTKLIHAGNIYADVMDWKVSIEGISPIGRFIFQQPGQPMYELLRGRVFRGGVTAGTIALSPGEIETLTIGPVFGFGHIRVRVTVSCYYSGVVAEKLEDGFLLGGRFLLYYGEE